MKKIFSQPGATAGLLGAVVFLQLAAVRVLSSATGDAIWFAGRELHWGCAFKQQFGVPCPNCGMTRSVLLTLHGHAGQAWEINPAGPLVVLGAVMFCATMFLLMRYQRQQHQTTFADANAQAVKRGIIIGSSVYGALVFAVLMAHWVGQVF